MEEFHSRLVAFSSHSIDFRADFFNVLDHPSFRQASPASIGSPVIGLTNHFNPRPGNGFLWIIGTSFC